MANDVIGLTLEIDGVSRHFKSVKELKEEIKKMDEISSKSDFGSEEYAKASKAAEDLRKKMSEISTTETKKMGNSLKDLQQQYKALKIALADAADPKEFAKLSEQLNEVEGKIGDINDIASTQTGSGIDRLKSSFGLLTEGFESFDTGKITNGFKAIGSAMSAIPIFLLIEGIKYLIDNWDQVVAVGKQVFNSFTDQERAVMRLTKEYENQQKVTAKVVKEQDREIALLEAQGASEAKLLEAKKKKIDAQILEAQASIKLHSAKVLEIRDNDTLVESAYKLQAAAYRKLGFDQQAEAFEKAAMQNKKERIEEELKAFTEAEESLKDLRNERLILDIEYNKKQVDNAQKANEKMVSDKKSYYEQLEKLRQEAEEAARKANQAVIDDFNKSQMEQFDMEYIALQKQIADRKSAQDKQIKDDQDFLKEITENHTANLRELQEAEQKINEDLYFAGRISFEEYEKNKTDIAKKYSQERAQQDVQLADQANQSLQALSDTIFTIKKSQYEKDSKEAKEAAKKQFQVNKALGISSTLIKGAEALVGALLLPPPQDIFKSIAVGLTTASSVAQIATAKFDEGGGSSSSAPSSAVGISGGLPSAPTAPIGGGPSTQFDSSGNTISDPKKVSAPMQVYVVESDISDSQKKINKIKTQATF